MGDKRVGRHVLCTSTQSRVKGAGGDRDGRDDISRFREGERALTISFIHIYRYPYIPFNKYVFISLTSMCPGRQLPGLYIQTGTQREHAVEKSVWHPFVTTASLYIEPPAESYVQERYL